MGLSNHKKPIGMREHPRRKERTMEKTSTLILEGGALRGVYTSGVLDAMMEQGIYVPNVVGVSAGSLNALSYLSRQPGRSMEINRKYLNDPRYMGPSHLLKSFSFFNFDFIFNEVFHELLPFDYKTFYESEQNMWAVATDCRTGKALFYHDKEMGEEFLTACRASSSMPLLCSMVKVGNDVCLDGGIACCVPLPEELPFESGKTVVVLTRQKGFRKKDQGHAVDTLYHRRYKNHPKLMEACCNQAEDYNRRIEIIEELERQGKIFVIRPQTPVTVTRTERDMNKLQALYQQGYDETMACMEQLKEYLGIDSMLDVSANTNPMGMPEAAQQAAADALAQCAEYPDPESTALRYALAQRHDVLAKNVLVGAGADDLVYRLVQAVRPKRAVIVEPAYEYFAQALAQVDCEVVHHTLKPEQDFALDMEQLLGDLENAEMLFLTNPANPTGKLLPREQMMKLVQVCTEKEILCVVDESFMELAADSEEHCLKQDAMYYERLLVLDTFSKTYAMPGLRVGFAVSMNGALLEKMAQCGQMFAVSAPAQAAAIAALEQTGYLTDTIAMLEQERLWLTRQLQELGLTVFESKVNFVLVQGPDEFCTMLRQNGVVTRDCSAMEGLDSSYCRIAVRDRQANEQLARRLGQLKTENGWKEVRRETEK